MDSKLLDYYVRGYLDALDTFENFSDMPAQVVVARAREWIVQRHPEIVERISADRTRAT